MHTASPLTTALFVAFGCVLLGCGSDDSNPVGTTESDSTEAAPVEWTSPNAASINLESKAANCPASAVGFYTPLSGEEKDWAGPGALCSGVLVGPNKIATAKHCKIKKGRSFYWFPGEQLDKVWKAHRDNISEVYEDFWSDYAQVSLKEGSSVTPAVVGDAATAKSTKLILTGAGFSQGTECHAVEVGTPDYFWVFGGKFSTSYTPYKMSPGDSGGPLFAVSGETTTVYGVDHGEAKMRDGKEHDVFTKIPNPIP